ncbi:MAG: sporulation transcription factor Spo0A [Christensenellales bacterium]
MRQRILIADDNRDFIALMASFISRYPEFEIVAEAHNGKEAILKIQEFQPDILLLDIIMPVLDGLAVLEQLQTMKLEKMPHIIAVTGLEQDKMIKKISTFDLEYILIKPFDFTTLIRRMKELGERGPKSQHAESIIISDRNYTDRTTGQTEHIKYLQRKISDILNMIGIPPSLKGFQYLREIITVSLEEDGLLKSVTKLLYPMVAEKYDTIPTRVERDIRHAIEVAWNKGRVDVLHKYFGYTVDGDKGKPTNSEFIAMMIDWIRLNRA